MPKKKGIVYVMSCAQGLMKIGCTQTDQFETRMSRLESDGYKQFNGFHREFAVEVDDYEAKEKLIHQIFDKSQVKINGKGIEMFATDLDLIIDLLKAFGGKQIYPKKEIAAKQKSNRLTFEMLDIPVGSELVYKDDPSIVVTTTNMKNGIKYQGKIYTLSGFVRLLKGGKAYQGGMFFLYKGKTLVELRKEKENGKIFGTTLLGE